MRKEIVLPPEWPPVALNCPKCPCALLARYNPKNGALETLRCPHCNWTQDFVLIAKQRKARLEKARRNHPPSTALQSHLDLKGDPPHGH